MIRRLSVSKKTVDRWCIMLFSGAFMATIGALRSSGLEEIFFEVAAVALILFSSILFFKSDWRSDEKRLIDKINGASNGESKFDIIIDWASPLGHRRRT